MALTKQMDIGEIRVGEMGVITVLVILRVRDDDGSIIGERKTRLPFPPDTPLAQIPFPRVRAIAEVDWTPARIAAYQALVAAALRTLPEAPPPLG